MIGFIELALIFVGEALADGAIFHVKEVDESVVSAVVVGDGEDVDIGDGVAYHLAFGAIIFNKYILLFNAFGGLKLEIFGQSLHVLIQKVAQLAGVSF